MELAGVQTEDFHMISFQSFQEIKMFIQRNLEVTYHNCLERDDYDDTNELQIDLDYNDNMNNTNKDNKPLDLSMNKLSDHKDHEKKLFPSANEHCQVHCCSKYQIE